MSAKEKNAVAVFLGHTRDDQAETVLLGLARGSGTRSLSGMAHHNGLYLRPLLEITRVHNEQYCDEMKLNYWNDPHNENPEFSRVRVRNEALPILEKSIGPGIAEALARSSHQLRDDADALDHWAKREEIHSRSFRFGLCSSRNSASCNQNPTHQGGYLRLWLRPPEWSRGSM
jgi:tRNA(Ile)-lysidine synthase